MRNIKHQETRINTSQKQTFEKKREEEEDQSAKVVLLRDVSPRPVEPKGHHNKRLNVKHTKITNLCSKKAKAIRSRQACLRLSSGWPKWKKRISIANAIQGRPSVISQHTHTHTAGRWRSNWKKSAIYKWVFCYAPNKAHGQSVRHSYSACSTAGKKKPFNTDNNNKMENNKNACRTHPNTFKCGRAEKPYGLVFQVQAVCEFYFCSLGFCFCGVLLLLLFLLLLFLL